MQITRQTESLRTSDGVRLQAGLGWGCQLALEPVRRLGEPALPPAPPIALFEMGDTCARIPAFAVNSGTGKPPAEERLIDPRIITLTLRHGAGSGTSLILPISATSQA